MPRDEGARGVARRELALDFGLQDLAAGDESRVDGSRQALRELGGVRAVGHPPTSVNTASVLNSASTWSSPVDVSRGSTAITANASLSATSTMMPNGDIGT